MFQLIIVNEQKLSGLLQHNSKFQEGMFSNLVHFGNPKYSFRVLRPSLLVAQSSFSFLAYPMKSGLQLSFLGNHLWMQYNMKIAFKNNFSGAIPTVDCSPGILTPSLLVF